MPADDRTPTGAGTPTDAGDAGPARAPRRRHRRVVRPATNEEAADPDGQTSDDTAAAWGERDEGSDRDGWLREQRPPHWG